MAFLLDICIYITGTNGWNATNWLLLGKGKEFIMFDDMHIFKVTSGRD